jgi:hypothetical protein
MWRNALLAALLLPELLLPSLLLQLLLAPCHSPTIGCAGLIKSLTVDKPVPAICANGSYCESSEGGGGGGGGTCVQVRLQATPLLVPASAAVAKRPCCSRPCGNSSSWRAPSALPACDRFCCRIPLIAAPLLANPAASSQLAPHHHVRGHKCSYPGHCQGQPVVSCLILHPPPPHFFLCHTMQHGTLPVSSRACSATTRQPLSARQLASPAHLQLQWS